jgi:hypothetical protein
MSKTDIVEIREPGGGKLLINRSKFDPAVHTLWTDAVKEETKKEPEKQVSIKSEKVEKQEVKTVDQNLDKVEKEDEEKEEDETPTKLTRRKYTKRN